MYVCVSCDHTLMYIVLLLSSDVPSPSGLKPSAVATGAIVKGSYDLTL